MADHIYETMFTMVDKEIIDKHEEWLTKERGIEVTNKAFEKYGGKCLGVWVNGKEAGGPWESDEPKPEKDDVEYNVSSIVRWPSQEASTEGWTKIFSEDQGSEFNDALVKRAEMCGVELVQSFQKSHREVRDKL